MGSVGRKNSGVFTCLRKLSFHVSLEERKECLAKEIAAIECSPDSDCLHVLPPSMMSRNGRRTRNILKSCYN